MLEKFNERKPGITRRKPSTGSWIPIATGYGSIHFEWLFRGRPLDEFLVALHFERGTYEENLKLLEYFISKKDEIEKEFPDEVLIFDNKFLSNWTQLYFRRESGDLDNENLEWGFETMIKLYEVLKPMLDKYFTEIDS